MTEIPAPVESLRELVDRIGEGQTQDYRDALFELLDVPLDVKAKRRLVRHYNDSLAQAVADSVLERPLAGLAAMRRGARDAGVELEGLAGGDEAPEEETPSE